MYVLITIKNAQINQGKNAFCTLETEEKRKGGGGSGGGGGGGGGGGINLDTASREIASI